MEFTRHTLIMSLLLFTLFSIIGGCVTHNASWKTLKLSYIIVFFCIIRFLFPFEFLGATVIRTEGIYATIDHWLRQKVLGNIQIMYLMCGIWSAGTIIYLTHFGFCLYKQWSFLQNCLISQEHSLYKLCSEASKRIGFSYKGTIGMSSDFSIPGVIGLFKPNLLLPDDIESFPKEYLPYIFYHELYHFKGKDSWIKLGLEILCALLWWNPAVYFLKNGIEHMLELRCDKNVCNLITEKEQRLYTNTLLFVAKQQVPTKKLLVSGYTGKNENIVYRFEEILNKKHFTSNILKPCITFILLLFSIASFVLSYQFILQPAFTTPSVEEEYFSQKDSEENKNSFILRQSNGTLMYFENGIHSANLTEDMLEKEPYCNVPIYDQK